MRPKAYPKELRERVIRAWQTTDISWVQLAALFNLGVATVNRWIRHYRATGSMERRPHGGGQQHRIPDAQLPLLKELVDEKPDRTLAELAAWYTAQTKVVVSTATIGRGLKRLGYTRKKKSLSATEREAPRIQEWRQRFLERLGATSLDRLVFVDEAGTHIAMTREWARGPLGQRVVDRVPRNRGNVLTLIGALDVTGVRALMTVEGGTTGEVFRTFVDQHLVPSLRPGDIVVLDQLGAHRMDEVREAIRRAGAEVVFLPPYSPDLNPIELCWSKLKAMLRSAARRTVAELAAVAHCLARFIRPSDARGWFRHCGYHGHVK
jgi:transposase